MAVNTRTSTGENANPNRNTVIAEAGLDTFILIIPKRKDADIIAKLKYKILTKIKGNPPLDQ